MKLKEPSFKARPIRAAEVLQVAPVEPETFDIEQYMDEATLKKALESLHDDNPVSLAQEYFVCLLLGDEVLEKLPMEDSWDFLDGKIAEMEEKMPDAITFSDWISVAAYGRYVFWENKDTLLKPDLLKKSLNVNKLEQLGVGEALRGLLHPDKPTDVGLTEDWANKEIKRKNSRTTIGGDVTTETTAELVALSVFFPHLRPQLRGLIPKLQTEAREYSAAIRGQLEPRLQKSFVRQLLILTAMIRVCMADSISINEFGRLLIEFSPPKMLAGQPLPERQMVD